MSEGRSQAPEAEDVFWQYLIACETEEPDFDAVCASHPEIAEELRRLHADWEHLAGVLTRLDPESSVSGRVARRFVPEVDLGRPTDGEAPGVAAATPSARDSADPGPLSLAVRQRLARRSNAFTRYRIGDEIDRGGMGVIYDAWDDDLRRHLAMKVLRTDHGPDVDVERRLGRFLEEAQVTGQLDHPGIVPVHELGLDVQGRVYFTMKLVRGVTLKDVFEAVANPGQRAPDGERWTVTRALGVLLKVCEAMAYAHAKGVVHRDLKPANIMVGRFGEVYVMDWGLAHVLGTRDKRDLRVQPPLDADTRPSTSFELDSERRRFAEESGDSPLITMDGDVVGTPAYMSPEQAAGKLDDLGPRSDVYAVGAMLYHLITKRMPYTTPKKSVNHLAVWSLVQEGPPPPAAALAPQAPPEIVAICSRAMARKPSERYADMGELSEDLRAYLERRVVRAYAAGPFAQLRKWVGRNRLAAGLAFAAMAIAIGAGFLWAWAERRTYAARSESIAQGLVERARASWPMRSSSIPKLREFLGSVESVRPYVRASGAAASTRSEPDAASSPIVAERAMLEALVGSYKTGIAYDRQWLGLAPSASGDASKRAVAQGGALDAHESERRTHSLAVLEVEVALLEERIEELRFLERQAGAGAFALLVGEEHGLARDVAGRLAALERAEVLLADDRWPSVCAEIADPAASPAYGGLRIEPQFGLVPLRRDPDSGLWEFLHVFSGDEPRVGADGSWQVDHDTGIVLVLVPGGRYAPGPAANPEREVDVAPFFLGKYELTQGQWWRATYDLPSEYHAGFEGPGLARISRAHPVETVSHDAARMALAQWDLVLPREAQWEYAARAGGPPACPPSEPDCFGSTNVFDRPLAIFELPSDEAATVPEIDGWALHAPVDASRANRFGLHHMLGNVAEWTGDRGRKEVPVGRTPEETAELPALEFGLRGGSFRDPQALCTPVGREFLRPDHSSRSTGLRAARLLDAE